MLTAGAGGAAVAVLAGAVTFAIGGVIGSGAAGLTIAAAAVGLYGSGMAAFMTYSSRVGKARTRESLLDLAQTLVAWTGRERVLDVGCGRGLMLVGAARRLTTGQATGIDLWRAEDQNDNGPEAAIENARREGVADRVRVETGDARTLPFADAAFDVVMSHWVVHNLPGAMDRARALDEMLRVLRPGGTLVLADIAHHDTYRAHLVASGLADLHERGQGFGPLLIGALSGGSFRPRAIVGRRARRRDPGSGRRRKGAVTVDRFKADHP